MAEEIIAAQEKEINELRTWLAANPIALQAQRLPRQRDECAAYFSTDPNGMPPVASSSP